MAPVKAPLPAPFEPSAHEHVDAALGPLPTAQTVGDLIDARKCSTGPTTTLNVQIAAEINCALPQAFAPIGHIPNISLGYGANPMMQAPAATALERAAARSPWLVMRVNSTWRSPLQQFILKSWEGSCGVGLAANPGRSQHESGLALDIPLESVYEFHDDLKAEGWRWFCDATNQGFANGCRDVPHYTASAGGRDMRALGLRAFGRLWNRAHPDDPIPVDGRFSKRTAARMRRAPLSGFPTGTTCGQSLPMAHSDRPFDDVPPSSPYRTAIEAHAELWGSCGEEGSRRFCPSEGVTRGELAVIVAQAMGLAPGAQRVDDVDPGSAQARAIGAVVQAGITQGCVVQERPQQSGALLSRGAGDLGTTGGVVGQGKPLDAGAPGGALARCGGRASPGVAHRGGHARWDDARVPGWATVLPAVALEPGPNGAVSGRCGACGVALKGGGAVS